MLDVIFYQSTDDLLVAFSEVAKSNVPIVICPSPLVADGLRRSISEEIEVITISKWVTDFLKIKNMKRTKKSELMLRLSSVWRHYFPEAQAHIFFKSFEVFTELRSYTLSLDLLSEFLNEFDPDTKKTILLFWTFVLTEKIIDEHLSYALIAKLESERPLWFIGFKQLSGVQIDMLKNISEESPVSLFFPETVYFESTSTDWIRWLIPEAGVKDKIQKSNLEILSFPKNKLNSVLNSLASKKKEADITLASKSLDFNDLQEICSGEIFVKSNEDIFRSKRDGFFELLNESMVKTTESIEDFKLRILDKKNATVKDQDFILFKTIALIEEAVEIYKEFQSTIDSFSLAVIKTIIELNTPRVALATLTNASNGRRVLDLNELSFRNHATPLIIVASGQYGPLKSSEGVYSEKMIDTLRVIAPIKRSGLEFSFLKNELVQILKNNQTILLMEDGLDLTDLSWREILNDFNVKKEEFQVDYHLLTAQDYLVSRIKPGPYIIEHYSASRLQSYFDCPRKYYFSYIEKMDHRPDERLKISADEMGIIEHAIIQDYFEGNLKSLKNDFNPDLHSQICKKHLDEFLEDHKIVLSEKTKLTTHYELLHFSQNGIEYLIEFCQKHDAIKIEFEKDLPANQWKLRGSIDCVVTLPQNQLAIFDFKRSQAAIGSKKETLNFEKIQIWVYLLLIQIDKSKKIHSWGYLNLSDLITSQIYYEGELPTLSQEKFTEFQQLIERLVSSLNGEIDYMAKPRVTKVCDFCEVQLYCTKGSC